MTDLLPPNATELEKALEQSQAAGIDLPVLIKTLWAPYDCPADLLPWLAWAVGVEEWSAGWSDQVKRDVIAATPEIRRHRGTVWAVREALRAAGYADAYLDEGLPFLRYDGAELYNGEDDYSGGSRWALFRVIADIGEERGVGGDELERLVRLIERAKPVRSVLREIAYQASVADEFELDDSHEVDVLHTVSEVRPAGLRYDASITYNQATQLPREPEHYDAAAWHNGLNQYDGLKPYHEWDVHGARHDNAWDALITGLKVSPDDRHEVPALYDGRTACDGAMTHGAIQPAAVDAGTVWVTLRRRHNSRLTYNGAHLYQGAAPEPMAI